MAKISVADNGKGIAEEFRDKIFEPKFTTKTSGMGLGLGMVKTIVENYKGSIEFTSKTGKGTVFTVRLPQVKKHKPAEA
jgi:signal transduction histidine kinase